MSDLHLLDEIGLDPASGIGKVQDQYGAELLARLSGHARRNNQGDAEVNDVYQDALVRLVDPGVRVACRAAGGSILPWLTKWGYWRLNDRARERRRLLGDGTEDILEGRVPHGVQEVEPTGAASAVAKALELVSPNDR